MTAGPIIYNLFPRLVGPMSKWLPHIERARDMGFNTIFVNPFHYPGFSGSLYAPKDYYDFNPLFMGEDPRPGKEQLSKVVAACARLGLRFMMDLVINHTAIDCPLVTENPTWYRRETNGEVAHPWAMDPADARNITVWGDLAEVDNIASVDREALWKFWTELVLHHLELGITDFRCDAAYKVPGELWKRIQGAARAKNQQVRFFAETLGCRLKEVSAVAEVGFDFLFNSSKFWNFSDQWCLDQYETFRRLAPSVAFPESHDTPRLAQETEGNEAASKMRYAFAAFFSAGVMTLLGYEWGLKKKTDVVTTQPSDLEEPRSMDISGFIGEVNRVKREHEIFNVDAFNLMVSGPQAPVFILKKSWNSERVLVIINKDLQRYQHLYFPDWDKWLEWPAPGGVKDISPEHRMESVPLPLDYHLRPGQVMVLHGIKP